MSNPFYAIAQIAEQRIQEAIQAGSFDNLSGFGKPLELEDDSKIPEDLRMAYKILKNAGCLPPEIQNRKEAANLLELLDNCPDEKERVKNIKRLRAILYKMKFGAERTCALESRDEYYQKILSRLEAIERKTGK